MKKSLIMKAMNSLMLIWKAGSSGDAAFYSGRHLKTELDSLHCMKRGKKSPPMVMLQASD